MGKDLIFELGVFGQSNDRIFTTKNITIKEGINLLVGANGSGKTTTIYGIYEKVNDIKLYNTVKFDNLVQGGTKSCSGRIIEYDVAIITSSEGERIIVNIGKYLSEIYRHIERDDALPIIILFDGVDSGMSINNIKTIMNLIQNTIIPHAKSMNKTIYIVMSVNNYACVKYGNCIDVSTRKSIEINSYEEYEKFIMKSADKITRRYNKSNKKE